MQNLRVLNDDDWEEICIFLMSHLVFKNINIHVSYQRYSRNGVKQHGVDLVPKNSDIGVYAQCKHKLMKVLTVKEILNALAETEKFPFKIQRFILLTTSNRDSHVQNQFMINQQPYIHTNLKNPEGFPVHIIYWDTIQDLSWLPEYAQRRFFPSLFQSLSISQQNPVESILALKSVIPKYLSKTSILWLENWNFREKNFIYLRDYNPFIELYIEYNRAKNSIDLAIGNRAELLIAIPSGQEIFNNLEELYLHIQSHTIRSCDQYGEACLLAVDDPIFISSYLPKLDQLAKNLAAVLRLYIFSQ